MSNYYAGPDYAARHYRFVGGTVGAWQVSNQQTLTGAPLASVEREQVARGHERLPDTADWVLTGVTSQLRYTTADEAAQLATRSAGLGRPEATCAALIPITKSPEWWALPQDERRHLIETRSGHISHSQRYLPAIARQLHHCRDLGEPFDFLTWFEFAPEHTAAFDDLVSYLRSTEEWRYVIREVDIRLVRDAV